MGAQSFTPDPRNEQVLVCINGEFAPRHEAKISVFDAGFVAGDGVWEGLRVHKGAIVFLEEHLTRLYDGACAISLDIGLGRREMADTLYETLRVNGMSDGAHMRLMVTRGTKSTPNQDPRNIVGKANVIVVAEYKLPSVAVAETGLVLATSTIRCTPADMFDMRLNSHSRLNLIRALLEVIALGADEALMLDPLGYVSSCNSTNFFIVKDGRVVTSTGEYCFNGCTRSKIIRLCRVHGIPVELRNFTLQEAHGADEAFLTGTFGGVTPVASIDGHVIGRDRLVTNRLRVAYRQLLDEEAARWNTA